MKIFRFLVIISSFIHTYAMGQTVECGGGVFYGLGNNLNIYKLTLSGNTISLNGIIVPAPVPAITMYGLAVSDVRGESNGFYSNNSGNGLLRYTNGQWQTLMTDTAVFHNAAGSRGLVFYQRLGTPNLVLNRISAYNGTSLVQIWSDSVFIPVSDLAADSLGNVYFFTSDAAQNKFLNIMSSTGTILRKHAVSFDAGNAYGCMFMNNTVYVAIGPANQTNPDVLLPFEITPTGVSQLSPISMPKPIIGGTLGNPTYLSFKDIDACSKTSTILGGENILFSARRENGTINRLEWSIAGTETGLTFEPQAATDGIHFRSLAKIEQKGLQRTYTWEDKAQGTVFYRLRTTARNGMVKDSRVIKLQADTKPGVVIFPSVASDVLHIRANSTEAFTYRITNSQGITLKTGSSNGSVRIDLSALMNGIYFITVSDEQGTTVRKFIVSR